MITILDDGLHALLQSAYSNEILMQSICEIFFLWKPVRIFDGAEVGDDSYVDL